MHANAFPCFLVSFFFGGGTRDDVVGDPGLAYHKLSTHLSGKTQTKEEDDKEEHDEGVNMRYFVHMFDKLKGRGHFLPSAHDQQINW